MRHAQFVKDRLGVWYQFLCTWDDSDYDTWQIWSDDERITYRKCVIDDLMSERREIGELLTPQWYERAKYVE